jgi:hypothetical protein
LEICSGEPSLLGKRKVSGNWIITTPTEGMTAQKATSGEIGATSCAIAFYCLNCIDGAGGSKTTARGKQGRNKIPISLDKPDESFLYGQIFIHSR